MSNKLQCRACKATCWVHGDYEPDTNAVNLDDGKVYEWDGGNDEFCEHVNFDIVDSEADTIGDEVI